VEGSKLLEMIIACADNLMKKGEVKEFGLFLDGKSGYAIDEGDSATTFEHASMFMPYIETEVHEIIPFEKGKEIMRAVMKAQAEAAKK